MNYALHLLIKTADCKWTFFMKLKFKVITNQLRVAGPRHAALFEFCNSEYNTDSAALLSLAVESHMIDW